MSTWRIATTVAAAAALSLAAAPAATAVPIPQSPVESAPDFVGSPAAQNTVFTAQPPQDPFMAANQRSEIHVDAYQTDTNAWAGPLGRAMQRTSTYQNADCASVGFDRAGRVITVCIGLQGPSDPGGGLYLFDPRTLAPLAHMSLPPRQPGIGQNPLTDFSSGGYFYVDDQDRAVIPTTTRHIWIVGETSAPGFALERDYDLTGAVKSGDEILSALPDWSGRIWFATRNGVVGTVDPASGAVRSVATNEPIGNSFAADETGGVYIVTDSALYRFTAGGDGTPKISWRSTYPNDGRSKPGQTEVGSGTTPTVMTGGYIAITDNADPIDVVVVRRDTGAPVCTQPVFSKGQSDTDQSLVAVGNALVAENNYGYASPLAVEEGRTTVGGLERVDVNADGHGCHKVWHSDEIAPSVVPKASLANGLVYTYTHPGGDTADPWYLTALDFRTGRTVYKYRAGSGLGFNNNYAPVTIGPDGTAYIGVLGGLALVRDAVPPPQIPQRSGSGSSSRRRPRVSARWTRGPGCTFTLRLSGRDRGLIRAVDVFAGGRRIAHLRHAPWRRRIRVHGLRRVRTVVMLKDGRRVSFTRTLRGCAAQAPRFAG